MTALLQGFPIVVRRPIDWGEMDAMRHVNNVAYLRWFETGRAALFERMGLWKGDAAHVGVILKSVACTFRAPLVYPDVVLVGVKVTDVGADRFTIRHAVVSETKGVLAAEGDGVVVAFDYQAQAKVAVPDAWRRTFQELSHAA